VTVRWGKQTELAVRNFPISGEQVPIRLVNALALIKAEAAIVNAQLGVIPKAVGDAIRLAANEIIDGVIVDQFPVDIFQTGSGTSTNMNVNEVIAHRASEILDEDVHPNDHVNASQSSNDTFPSATRISSTLAIVSELIPALDVLGTSLHQQSLRHDRTVKMGRTHLMDAVPMTFGQELSAWAAAIEYAGTRMSGVLPRLSELPLGGTAVGTGLNSPRGFGAQLVDRLSARAGFHFIESANHFEAQASQDAVVETSGMLKVAAVSLNKIAGDLRLLASGPNGGLAEVRLRPLQAGSSIMPGKVNPVIPEVVQQVAAQVVGNDATVTFATAACSTLQLTTAMPVIARSLLSSITLLARAAQVFDKLCVRDLEVDAGRMLDYAMASPAIATAFAPLIGYEAAAALAADATKAGITVAELIATRYGDVDIGLLARPHATDDAD
jgi:fumarate hydratase class II